MRIAGSYGRVVVLLICMVGARAIAQRSSTMNLERLVEESGMIFSGRVVDVETGKKETRMNLFVTYYTFEVFDHVYGVESDTITIKQYGGEAGGRSFHPPGVPRFEKGEEVLLMMYAPSKIGMTSTVGKDQGKFLIQGDDSVHAATVSNNLNNKGLFRRLRHPQQVADPIWVKEQRMGPLAYGEFVQTIRNLVEVLKKNQ